MNQSTTTLEETPFHTLREHAHPRCVVCSPDNPMGLGLKFVSLPDASVEGAFDGSAVFEGYPGRLHGGIIASLLDGAMTNCLFARGYRAFTAELNVRYRHPVAVDDHMTVRAWLDQSRSSLHLLRAELRQNGQVKVTARGKFINIHE